MGGVDQKTIPFRNGNLQSDHGFGINCQFLMTTPAKQVVMGRLAGDLVNRLVGGNFGFDNQAHCEQKVKGTVDRGLVNGRRFLLHPL